MIFVLGGAYSGKSDYVREAFGVTDIAECGAPGSENARAVRNFHLYVRDVMRRGGDVEKCAEELIRSNPDVIIISDEIGCGIVPEDAFMREWRETAGRAHCFLAKRAKNVIRVVCGIGRVIK